MTHDKFPVHTGEQSYQPGDKRNLNDSVLVRVFPEGEKLWDASKANVVAAFPEHADAYKLPQDEQGNTRMQLHDVMRVFGGPDMPHSSSPIETEFTFVADEDKRNLNDSVLIKVLPEGERIWDAYYAPYRAHYEATGQPVPDAYLLERDEEGFTRMQLHDVMRYFGGPDMPLSSSPIETEFKFV